MFQGETAITIDDKGRLTIPTHLREQVAEACGGRMVLTYSPFEAGVLYLYPVSIWERTRDQVNTLSRMKSGNRLLQLKLVGSAAHLDIDASSRLSLPASHRSAASLERRAVLVGNGEKFELWSEQAHAQRMSQTLSDDDMDSEDLLGIQL
ncbi:MAG: division/cell wall cluster transcriptional repressor MraZ [Pseudomonadota bacterium]|nr:division/cell wall cluster transcriptional repressor MraZ [Pseudomonadota bacterium]